MSKVLSKSKILDLVETLDAEVNNGGFHQFFSNSSGSRAAETISALDAIGASHTAEILKRACARFPGGMPPRAWEPRRRVLDKIAPSSSTFDEETKAFYEYHDNLIAMAEAFGGG